MRMRSKAPALLAVLALAGGGLAACGGDDDDDGGSSSTTAQAGGAAADTKQNLEGKKGGTMTFLAAGDVDFLDPGQTYYTVGFQVAYATNRQLYAFKPSDTDTPTPDIAEAAPEITDDNKTITVKLRKGIKFAPPVDREVTSKDIKYAFERAFTKQVPSGYASTYFGDLVGVPSEPNTGDYKPISGIETPDDYTIVFKLSKPNAVTFAAALVMPITTPVPQEYAEKFDKKNPTTYDQYVAFTGPYMITNNAEGKVTGRSPGKQIEMVRNPNWDAKTDFRPAYLDKIVFSQGNDDATVASRRALQGSNLTCCDAGTPPAQILKQAQQRYKGQTVFIPSGGTRWVALNSTIKPLDNLNVRKAIVAGMDKDALRLARGGAVIGDLATGYIPPGIPGYEESGGLQQGKTLDFNTKPRGDLALAKKYFAAAKAEGVEIGPDGLYGGSEELLMIGTNADPGKRMAEVAQGQLEKLGFKLNFRIVPQDTLYTKFCNVPKAKVAICPNVGWFKDFSDPQAMLQTPFNGDEIRQQNNSNWAQLDVKAINDAMDAASATPSGAERNQQWAKINNDILAQAPGVPIVWDKSAEVASKNVNLVMNPYYAGGDFNYTSIK